MRFVRGSTAVRFWRFGAVRRFGRLVQNNTIRECSYYVLYVFLLYFVLIRIMYCRTLPQPRRLPPRPWLPRPPRRRSSRASSMADGLSAVTKVGRRHRGSRRGVRRAFRRASEVIRDRRALLGRHRRAPPFRGFLGRWRRALLRRRGPRRRRRSGFSSGFAASAHGALQESGFGALVVIRAGWTGPHCDFCHGSGASIERSQCVRSAVGL